MLIQDISDIEIGDKIRFEDGKISTVVGFKRHSETKEPMIDFGNFTVWESDLKNYAYVKLKKINRPKTLVKSEPKNELMWCYRCNSYSYPKFKSVGILGTKRLCCDNCGHYGHLRKYAQCDVIKR